MSNTRLKTLFENIKNERRGGAPHEDWVSRNRDILMMQIRNTTDQDAKRNPLEAMRHFFDAFMPYEMVAVAARAVGVFVLSIGIVLGGGMASAQVYNDAVPGDMMYGFKIAVEKAQVMLAPNDDYRTRLHAEFADRRMDEIARLAEGSVLQQGLVTQALDSFETELAALSGGLETLKTADPHGVVETAKLLERKMAVYQKMLRNAGTAVPPEIGGEIAETRTRIDDLTIDALAVIVEKHLEGDEHAPRTVVLSKFEQQLRDAEAALGSAPTDEGSTSSFAQAQRAIADAKDLIDREQYTAALAKISEVAELTKDAESESGETEAVSEESDEEGAEEDGEESIEEEGEEAAEGTSDVTEEVIVSTDDASASEEEAEVIQDNPTQ